MFKDSVFLPKKIRLGWRKYKIVICDQHGFELHFKQNAFGEVFDILCANMLCDKINGDLKR